MTVSPPVRDTGLRTRRRWMDEGTAMVLGAAEILDDAALAGPSEQPGWSRRHVIAHVAANADALTRLAGWARTGREDPMYGSPQQRTDEIDAGSALPAPQLRRWLRESAMALQTALDGLDEQQWAHEVVTAQGRLVPATELPWLRAREVMVHAVDLATGITFADLPPAFTVALVDDVVARRSLSPGPQLTVSLTDGTASWRTGGLETREHVVGPLAAIAAWLTGRPAPDVRTADGRAAPDLPAWL